MNIGIHVSVSLDSLLLIYSVVIFIYNNTDQNFLQSIINIFIFQFSNHICCLGYAKTVAQYSFSVYVISLQGLGNNAACYSKEHSHPCHFEFRAHYEH